MADISGRFDCPKCGEGLREDPQKVYATTPASRYTFCQAEGCGFEAARTLGYVRELISLPEEKRKASGE